MSSSTKNSCFVDDVPSSSEYATELSYSSSVLRFMTTRSGTQIVIASCTIVALLAYLASETSPGCESSFLRATASSCSASPGLQVTMITGGSALISGIYYVFATPGRSFGPFDEVRASSDPTGIRLGNPGWFSDPFKEDVFRHWDSEQGTSHIGNASQHSDGRALTEIQHFNSTSFLSAQHLATLKTRDD